MSFVLLAAAICLGAGAEPDSSSAGSGAAPIPSSQVRNLFRASPQVFSGSAPESTEAFAELARLGVKTIISVDGRPPEVSAARRHGLGYIHLPIGYDGLTTNRVAELVKAAQSREGPFYVHCHQGLHRGPAAAAVMCQAASGWSSAQATAWLKEAGTSEAYAGLYRSVAEFRQPAPEELARVGDLPETTAASSFVETMVAIDDQFDLLKAAQASGWSKIPGHPEWSPAHAATILWEHFRELHRAGVSAGRTAEFLAEFNAAEKAASHLRASLGGLPSDASRDAAFAALSKTCSSCHQQFRK